MRPKRWMLRMVLLLALAPVALAAEEPGQIKWNLSAFTWVQRVPAEAGAPANEQPAQLGADRLEALLGPVLARVDGKEVRLFGKNELKELASALSEAFALAQPGEDLVLVTTSRHGGGLLERAEALTARLFVQSGALHLIVHDARLEFMDAYIAYNLQPAFVYGSRKTPSAERLQAPGVTRLRPDWLALPLAPAAHAPLAAPAPVPPAAPVAAPALTPPAAPKAAPEPAPSAAEAGAYEAKAQRLRTLKRLRDDNLISEAEYQEKREAILRTL